MHQRLPPHVHVGASLPLLRPLVLVLKQLLASAGLSCGFRGGLSSYARVPMATHAACLFYVCSIYRYAPC